MSTKINTQTCELLIIGTFLKKIVKLSAQFWAYFLQPCDDNYPQIKAALGL